MTLNVDIALATVSDVASELGIAAPSPSQIAMIEELITTYSDAVSSYIGRGRYLGYNAAIVQPIRGYGTSPRIILNRLPIYSVTSVSYDRGVTQTLWADISCANIDDEGRTGIIYLEHAARYSGLASPWINAQQMPGTEFERCRVTYAGGWGLPGQTGLPSNVVMLPGLIRLAVIKGAASAYSQIGGGASGEVKSESLMSHSVTYDSASESTPGFGVGYVGIGMSIPAPLQHALARYQVLAQA